ncbi:hypothetical protein B7463_g7699, partial [Scytalidium lignicola]
MVVPAESIHSLIQPIYLDPIQDKTSTVPWLSTPPGSSKPLHSQHQDECPDYLRLILTSAVYDCLEETPLTAAINLSQRLGCQIFLKREDLQPSLTSRVRGVYNKMASIPFAERWRGVVAYSNGDHAVAVAYAAKLLNMPSIILMLDGVPGIRDAQCSRLDATVVICKSEVEALERCQRLQTENRMAYIPTAHDPYSISGEATVGLELVKQWKRSNISAVFCPSINLDLTAGMAVLLKCVVPETKIIVVEFSDCTNTPEHTPGRASLALKSFNMVESKKVVHSTQGESYRLCRQYVDESLVINAKELFEAIHDIYEETRHLVDGAGAMALAGLKKYASTYPKEKRKQLSLCAIISGANVEFSELSSLTDWNSFRKNKYLL